MRLRLFALDPYSAKGGARARARNRIVSRTAFSVLGDFERIGSGFDRHSVKIASIVVKNLFEHGKFLSITSTSTFSLSTRT
jgi:hypothetical protein